LVLRIYPGIEAMLNIVRILAIPMLIGAFMSVTGLAAQEAQPGLPMTLFRSDGMLDLVLEADFKKVFSVTDDSTYFPATIKLKDFAGMERAVSIEIRTRGLTRRQGDVCRFPPLRLKFPKDEAQNTPFEGQKAIKLVTHCDRSGRYEQNTIIEYLIYRAFNVLTDSSFRVRPATISYVYSDSRSDTLRRFAFFIEREKHLSDRMQGIEIEVDKIHPNRLDSLQSCLVDIFEYMIGNTDYSLYEQHNIILVGDPEKIHPFIPVPYDFDWSGMVSAPYAVPHPIMETEHVSERVYRGLRKPQPVVLKTIRLFNAKKPEIYRLFGDNELLDKEEKKRIVKYLDEFYWTINNERMVQSEFIDRARVMNN
jgi:hypothetical protein